MGEWSEKAIDAARFIPVEGGRGGGASISESAEESEDCGDDAMFEYLNTLYGAGGRSVQE